MNTCVDRSVFRIVPGRLDEPFGAAVFGHVEGSIRAKVSGVPIGRIWHTVIKTGTGKGPCLLSACFKQLQHFNFDFTSDSMCQISQFLHSFSVYLIYRTILVRQVQLKNLMVNTHPLLSMERFDFPAAAMSMHKSRPTL